MAKGYNIYTGVQRTPAALSWMLAKRTHLHGEIVKLQKVVADAPAKIAKLQATLASLDETIGMHEIHVDLATLPPRQKHVRRIQLPYGAVSKTIWMTLRENGNQPLKTSRFTQALIGAYKIPVDKETMGAVRRTVISALNSMVKRGQLEPLHSGVGPREGSWALTEYGDRHVPRTKRCDQESHATPE